MQNFAIYNEIVYFSFERLSWLYATKRFRRGM